MKTNDFLNISLQQHTLDTYYVRQSIFKALCKNKNLFSGDFIDVGCGKMPYREFLLSNSSVKKYIGLDIETALEYEVGVKPDFTWDGAIMPFENNSFDSAMATEVLEHCPKPEIVLKEIYRTLKSGGLFFFTVPFLWPLHEVPYDEFRYTPFSLSRLLNETGFVNVEIQATGGWHASMAQMLGLWVKRAPMGNRSRSILCALSKTAIRYLIKKDEKSVIKFTESQMITGLTGIGYKKL